MGSTLTSSGQKYCGLLAELSRLRGEGADEAIQDAHLDKMDAPWWGLSDEDKVIIGDRLGAGEWP